MPPSYTQRQQAAKILSPGMYRMVMTVCVSTISGLVVMFWPPASRWFTPAACLHIALGMVAAILWLGPILSHAREQLRRKKPASNIISGLSTALVHISLIVTGIMLILPLMRQHVGSQTLANWHSALGLVLVGCLGMHRAVILRQWLMDHKYTGLLLFIGICMWALWPDTTPHKKVQPIDMDQPTGTLRTQGGLAKQPEVLAQTQSCGLCHAQITAQWQASAHRFSSLANPFYLASLQQLTAQHPPTQARLCGQCHDPVLLLRGFYDQKTVSVRPDVPDADAGVTCLVCHINTSRGHPGGNGGLVLHKPPALWPTTDAIIPNDEQSVSIVQSLPRQHRVNMSPASLREPSMCGTCHKVGLTKQATGWQFWHDFNDYNPWQASGYSGESASDGTVVARAGCIDCHMPLVQSDDPAADNGKIRSHHFAGGHTALTAYQPDPSWEQAQQHILHQARVQVEPIGITTNKYKKLDISLGLEKLSQNRPSEITLHTVVTARGVGHIFPGGTRDAAATWVALSVVDANNRRIAQHAWPSTDRFFAFPPPGAHVLKSQLLDKNAQPIVQRDTFRARAVMYDNRVPPGSGHLVRYRFVLPRWAKLPLRGVLRVYYAKYSQTLIQTLNPRARTLGHQRPRVIAQTSFSIPPDTQKRCALVRSHRFTPYVMGALSQGDNQNAQIAARALLDCHPAPFHEIWLARALWAVGKKDEALRVIESSVQLINNFKIQDKAMYVLADILTKMGDHNAAQAAVLPLQRRWPRDLSVQLLSADIALQQNKPNQALGFAQQALQLDPVSSRACYTAMRAALAVAKPLLANTYKRCFERFSTPTTNTALLKKRRAQSVQDRLEADPLHVHEASWRRR